MAKKTDEDYVKYVLKCLTEAKDATDHIHKRWRELWQLFQCKQDWSDKADWQCKAFMPKIPTQIERAAGEVKRAIMQLRKLFKFELDDHEEREAIQQLEEQRYNTDDPNEIGDIMQEIRRVKDRIKLRTDRMIVRERQFKQELADTNLMSIYSAMIEPAFLLGLGIPKVLWDTKKKRPVYENVDALNFWISPDYMPSQERPKYDIERQEIDLATLRKRAKVKGSQYRKAEVAKIESDYTGPEDRVKEQQRRGLGQYTKSSGKVELIQFWGDVIHEDDKKIEENVLLVVANRQYLIRKQANPFKHKKNPYILTTPKPYPHRGLAGKSLVDSQVSLQYLYNNIVNMIADGMNWTVNPMYEANVTDLAEPTALTAIWPGKVMKVNTTNQQPAIREVRTAPKEKGPLELLSFIDREMQEATSVTEYVSGLTGKKTKTKGEVDTKTSQSKSSFDTIARDLEQNSIKPLLEMSYDLYVQFKRWEPREGNYIFVVGGLSLLVMQKEQVERMGQVLALALKSPDIAQRTDIDDLWKKYLSLFNLQDVHKEPEVSQQVLRPEQEQGLEQKAQQDAKAQVSRMNPREIMRLAG
jgi:hypothetical protein